MVMVLCRPILLEFSIIHTNMLALSYMIITSTSPQVVSRFPYTAIHKLFLYIFF